MFYVPNLPYAFYLALKARSLTFFTAANPAIKSSGNGTESKYKTIQLVPEKYRPKSVLVKPNSNFDNVVKELLQNKITYPLIAKPDIGFRGLLVKKIYSEVELKKYLEKYPLDIIIQEFLDYENECGIFYHRLPNSKTGKITSLTLKQFITVTGNGINTLEELILTDERAKLYIDLFKDIHQETLYKVPSKDKIVKLTAIGNHSKGTQFINGNHLISEKLEATFDELNKNIEGWYYGRIDLKYNTFENLENGSDFKVIEINGIIAEPTHIYDSENYSYFKALKSIRNHWKNLFEISSINHSEKKTPYISPFVFLKEMFQLKGYVSNIKKLNT
ncbi:hypothetical protein WH52_09880 [Tenacibaculum holothuriorum]|uniref:D-alanine--D-alanine ligase n=2 Tax=Tenacibaculum holothuriorum TaxID=1635173 RepID=A0A1Y2PDU7_9FLAO|nr:hypothetical protein WH52_09880 [Tenacibaculum holothuriorum]